MFDSKTFRQRIYRVVSQIPRGKVASHGLVALLAGRIGAARAVGAAMREAPNHPQGKKLPCHRVIKSDGSLAPTRIFRGRQRPLLESEGILFRINGRVDMAQCEWDGLMRKSKRRHK